MASENLREECIAGNAICFESVANDALGPLEGLRKMIDREGEVGGPALCSASRSDVLGTLVTTARETILRAGGVALIALVLILAATPTPGHA